MYFFNTNSFKLSCPSRFCTVDVVFPPRCIPQWRSVTGGSSPSFSEKGISLYVFPRMRHRCSLSDLYWRTTLRNQTYRLCCQNCCGNSPLRTQTQSKWINLYYHCWRGSQTQSKIDENSDGGVPSQSLYTATQTSHIGMIYNTSQKFGIKLLFPGVFFIFPIFYIVE